MRDGPSTGRSTGAVGFRGLGGLEAGSPPKIIASATVPNPSRDPHSSRLSFRFPQ